MGASDSRPAQGERTDERATYKEVAPNARPPGSHVDFRDFADKSEEPVMLAVLDPLIRIMSDSVIAHRLSGFSSVVVASMLLTTLAFSAVLVLVPSDKNDMTHDHTLNIPKLIALIGMLLTVCLNLFCSVVIIQQMYLVNRIATSGAMGFEMAKSLYLSKTYVTVRHIGIACFDRSIPLFVGSTAMMVWEQISSDRTDAMVYAIIVVGVMFVVTLLMFYVHHWQRRVFQNKLRAMQAYEHPMRHHMEVDCTGRSQRGEALLGSVG